LPLLTHRLKGSAALYGFPALSELAGLIEDLLARLRGANADEHRRGAELVADFVELLKTTLKRSETDGGEDADAIAAFRARHGDVLARETTGGGEVEQVVRELDRFFATNTDVMTYFGSEATGHLDVMAGAVRALEAGEATDDTLPT